MTICTKITANTTYCGRGGVCCGDTLCEELLNKKVGGFVLTFFAKSLPVSILALLGPFVSKELRAKIEELTNITNAQVVNLIFRLKEQKKFEEEQKDG